MANVDAPNGFTPAYHLTGGTIRAKEYRIADDEPTAIFSGDLVKLTTNGVIQVAAAGERAIGVFQGARWQSDDGSYNYGKFWPAAQSVLGSYAQAYVYDDPNIVFRAQFDAASGIVDIGNLCDMISTHAGSTSTGRSGQELNSTTGTGAATFRILDFVDDPDNDPAQNNAEAYVQFFEHELVEHGQATPGV